MKMNKKYLIWVITLLLSITTNLTPLKAQFSVDLETGAVSTGYNDVRIPGDQGTLFSLKDDLISKTEFFFIEKL